MRENFTMKDGRTVLIRRIRASDYEMAMSYLEKFSKTPSAMWTYQYPGRPKADKEKSVKAYEDPKQLFLGVFDGNTLVGLGQIGFVKPFDGACRRRRYVCIVRQTFKNRKQ